MTPSTMLKLRITMGAIWDDILDLASLPLMKGILWLLSLAAAFAMGLAL